MIDTYGVIQCWGNAGAGALGPNVAVAAQTTSSPVTVLSGMTQVAAGGRTACAVDPEAHVLCWGSNVSGELGHDPSTDPISECPDSAGPCNPVPTYVLDGSGAKLSGVTSIAVGQQSACALKGDGTLWCWGAAWLTGNDTAQVDAQASQITPVQVLGLPL